LIRVTFLDEEAEEPVGEESAVEILLQRLNEDGSVDEELTLEGDLADARRLALKLSAEGNCVEVEIAQPDEEGEGEEEVPTTGEEVIEPVESPELVSP